jgi:hypothetical protein
MAISLSAQSASYYREAGQRLTTSPAFKKILYRGIRLGVILALFGCFSAFSQAQEEAPPQITPREKAGKKKSQGPRALGLVRMTANGKATLVPIAIRVDGKFYDAAAYKAAPVPMALESGTVYEAERTGSPVGLFTVNGALHSQAINAVTPWIATGMWLAAGSEAPNAGRKAETVPVGIEATEGPPRLTKSGTAKTAETPAPSATPPPPAGSPSTGTPPGSKPEPEPQSKPESKSSGGSQPAQTSAPANPPASASAKPSDQNTKAPPADQRNKQSDDSNRPRLRRGKPTEPLPSDDDVPGYSKPGAAPAAAKGGAANPAASAVVQVLPAISDAGGPDPRSFAFEWGKGEEADRRKQLIDLAKDQLRLYLAGQAKASVPASAPNNRAGAKTSATASKKIPKAAEPIFENVQMRTFDLWANNQPIMVLTAEAHIPEASAKTAVADSSTPPVPQYTVTVAARTDIYGSLHKLYAAVTDRYHLDVTPRLELVDAVDAEGDGRGELLFRETTDGGSGYVIYRATADTLWKMFDSLNQE